MIVLVGLVTAASFALAALLFLVSDVSPPALIHLVFAVGAVPLVFAAMLHFVPVLTRSRGPAPALTWIPHYAQLAGLLAVAAMAGWAPYTLVQLSAALDLMLCVVLMLWMRGRAGRALGGAHRGWLWYFMALALLALGLAAVLLSALWPAVHSALRALHLHINTLGFLGMAAFGTLPVLLPTALGRGDPGALKWLTRWRWAFVAGALCAGLAAAFAVLWRSSGMSFSAFLPTPLVLAAITLFGVAAVSLLPHWRAQFGWHSLRADPAALSLGAAVAGFIVMLGAGLLHGMGVVNAQASIGGFAGLFLFPLVSGALTHLLPVWRHAGVATETRSRMRKALGFAVLPRVLCFQMGGLLLMSGAYRAAWATLCLGLLLFLTAIIRAFSVAGRRSA